MKLHTDGLTVCAVILASPGIAAAQTPSVQPAAPAAMERVEW